MAKRRRHNISSLCLDGDEWCSDQARLANAAVTFYQKLFTKESNEHYWYPIRGCFPRADSTALNHSVFPASAEEIHTAVLAIGVSKTTLVRSNCSRLWKGLSLDMGHRDNVHWIFGNGKSVAFWSNVWVRGADGGDWKWEIFQDLLPTNVLLHIAAYVPPNPMHPDDKVAWSVVFSNPEEYRGSVLERSRRLVELSVATSLCCNTVG
ncbi:hypothetical protein V6N13_132976 [Hibiscus sabdariffa]